MAINSANTPSRSQPASPRARWFRGGLGGTVGCSRDLLDPAIARRTAADRVGRGASERDGTGTGAGAECGTDCGHDRLLAFSCKGRGACPSCNAWRMAEVAAHLTDEVIPHLPVRQWVLSVPKRLRPFLHQTPEVASAVLGIFLRALRSELRDASPGAPDAVRDAKLGAISFPQRFGSSLNPH